MANFQLDECHYQADFTNHSKLKLKATVPITKYIVKTQLEFAVWRDFLVVGQLIPHSLFYFDQFSIIWVHLAGTFLKLHQIDTKNLFLSSKNF